MINATLTVKIQSVDETHDDRGVKIAYGDCSFYSYSKDGLVKSTMPFRAKGAAAVAIAVDEAEANGVAIGYIDLEVIDTGNGYKEKKCTLVIRNFIPTLCEPNLTEKQLQSKPAEPVPDRTLAGAVNEFSNNEYENIPF